MNALFYEISRNKKAQDIEFFIISEYIGGKLNEE